jgi:hypothetical protein
MLNAKWLRKSEESYELPDIQRTIRMIILTCKIENVTFNSCDINFQFKSVIVIMLKIEVNEIKKFQNIIFHIVVVLKI